MLISELNTTELGLTTVNGTPSATKPETGDIWISKDDRLIIITRVEEPSVTTLQIKVQINGEFFEINAKIWPMVLLSM